MKRQTIRKAKSAVEVQVDVVLLKEGDYYVALCPSYKPPRLSVFPEAAAFKKSKLRFKEKIAIPL